MATIAEQVAQDVARGLYSAEVGEQILANAGMQTSVPTPIQTANVGAAMAENQLLSQYQYDTLAAAGHDMTGFTVPEVWSDPVTTAPDFTAATGSEGAANGQELVHAYWGPGSRQAGEYVGLVSAADAAFANYVVRPGPPEGTSGAAPGTASIDQQIIDRLNAEEVIPLSELAQMSDSAMQTRAATQLAKNIVKQLGNSEDAINLVRGIFGEYFDTPESGGFGTWAASVGLTGLSEVQSPATNVDISYKLATADTPEGTAGTIPSDAITMVNALLTDLGTSGRGFTHQSALDQIASDFSGNLSNFPGWSNTGRPDSEFRTWLSDVYLSLPEDQRSTLGLLFPEGVVPGDEEQVIDPAAIIPGATTTPAAYEGLLPFGGVGAERTFGDVYGGFVGGLPGVQMPSIAGALRSAGDPLRTQFWMQQPGLPQVGTEGEYGGRTAAVDFLNSLMQGTGGILRGPELGGALRNIASALTGTPDMLGMGALGGAGSAQSQYYDRFQTLEAQRKAFEQPFLLSTVGAPEKRSALQDAISRAATQFQYKYPGGVPIAGGTGTQQFLPWAISQNLLGIQDLLPSLASGSTQSSGWM
jgi:hypothetical protein